MAADQDQTTAENPGFIVVINDEEQYSIWPAHIAVPAGWHREGMAGPKDACLAHIGQVWTDMRPLSMRRQLER